jgi:transposase-like protein
MSEELRPRWEGVLLLDEKMCRVKGNRQWFYLAVDTTGDILHCRAVQELSSTTAGEFLRELEALPVRLKGVVTDLDTALVRAVSVVWPEMPHQYCLKHALAAIGILIGYVERNARRPMAPPVAVSEEARRLGDDGSRETPSNIRVVSPRQDQRYAAGAGDSGITLLYKACQKILMAGTEHRALVQYDALRRDLSVPRLQHRRAVRFLKRHWNKLMTHHRVVEMPRTTNLVENVNKQLERRYKTIEAFQRHSTAIHYTNLLVAYLRQKPYTDCRGSRKHLNGKSRLASAKVRGLDRNWLKNCLKPPV